MNKNFRIDPVRLIKQVLLYAAGLMLLSVGVTISIKSNLGVSPINSIPYVLSQALKVDMGMVVTLYFASLILLQILLLRRQFNPINLLQIVFASMNGAFIDFTNGLARNIPLQTNLFVQLILLVISVLVVALGLRVYLCAQLVPMPAEGAVNTLSGKTGLPFHRLKVIFDTTSVIVAAAISLAAFGRLSGVGIGTILSALLIGRTVGLITPYCEPALKRFVG